MTVSIASVAGGMALLVVLCVLVALVRHSFGSSADEEPSGDVLVSIATLVVVAIGAVTAVIFLYAWF